MNFDKIVESISNEADIFGNSDAFKGYGFNQPEKGKALGDPSKYMDHVQEGLQCKKCGKIFPVDNVSPPNDKSFSIAYDNFYKHFKDEHGIINSYWDEKPATEGMSLADWAKVQDKSGWYRVVVHNPNEQARDYATSLGGSVYGSDDEGIIFTFHDFSEAERFADFVRSFNTNTFSMDDVKDTRNPLKSYQDWNQPYMSGPYDSSPTIFTQDGKHTKLHENFAMTGGQYPSEEDNTNLDDDANNIGAVDDHIENKIGQKGTELNSWNDDSIVQHTDNATPLEDVDGKNKDGEPQKKVQPDMPMGEANGTVPDWFTCPICPLVFDTEIERNEHVENDHGDQSSDSDDLFEALVNDCGCDKSKEAFYKKYGISIETEEGTCDICGKPAEVHYPPYTYDHTYHNTKEKQRSGYLPNNEGVTAGWVPELSTRPTDDDYRRNNPENKCVMCGRKFNTLQEWKDHMDKLGPHNSTTIGANEEHYPWNQCIEDNKDKGMDSAKKICGSIKAKYGESDKDKLENTMDNDNWNALGNSPANEVVFKIHDSGSELDWMKEFGNVVSDNGNEMDISVTPGKEDEFERSLKLDQIKYTKQGSESFTTEWDNMTPIQRHDWIVNKVGAFEALEKFTGVSYNTWNKQDLKTQERLTKLAESQVYSYEFKKKDQINEYAFDHLKSQERKCETCNGSGEIKKPLEGFEQYSINETCPTCNGKGKIGGKEYYRDPADFPDPHPKSTCDECHVQYRDHGDKGDKVPANIKDEYELNFDTWDHDWTGEGDYDDSDEQYERRRDQELEDKYRNGEVKKKLNESDTNPTEEDIKKWWDIDNNISQKVHAHDPNRLDEQNSITFCETKYDDQDSEGKRQIWIAYSFRHQEADMTPLLGYNISETPQIWWDTYNTSQHQHMVDPHQMLNESLDFADKKYITMTDDEKAEVDRIFEKKHSESSSATQHAKEGGHGSGRIGHAPWMKPITQKKKSPETINDIPIDKINEADGTWDNWEEDSPTQLLDRFVKRFPNTTEADLKKWAKVIGIGDSVVKEYLGEGILSDYLLKRNGQDFSYCNYCNARTRHLYGKCTNCPPPKLVNQPQTPTKKNNTPAYDITNIKPSTDPDDANEAVNKCKVCGKTIEYGEFVDPYEYCEEDCPHSSDFHDTGEYGKTCFGCGKYFPDYE